MRLQRFKFFRPANVPPLVLLPRRDRTTHGIPMRSRRQSPHVLSSEPRKRLSVDFTVMADDLQC